MQNLPYDKTDPLSIESYAKRLLGKSLSEVLDTKIVTRAVGKGGLGQALEELYFLYKPNSISGPDFPEAKVELKTTPVKRAGKKIVSKERLVFNIINYNEEYKKTFVESSFWTKNQLLLLMFYLYEQETLDIDSIFMIIRLWQFPAPDLKIIMDDWQKIVQKIKDGKAHELSEGDTMYLGACTKGANAQSMRTQPFSPERARQRAFSLKSKYLNFIIEKSLANEEVVVDYEEYDRLFSGIQASSEPRALYTRLNRPETEPIVKSIYDYGPGETFEDLVGRKFASYIGKGVDEIMSELALGPSKAKNILAVIANAILGVGDKKPEEFQKAEIVMKTISLEKGGALKESMSFAQIQFKQIVHEEWEDSYWFNMLTKRFFFVVFQKDRFGVRRLRNVKFWTMPAADLEIAREFWEDTKQKIQSGDFEHFIKISDDRICHVRPKAINSQDLMGTEFGTFQKKKAYWLNSTYIKRIVAD